MIRRLPSLTALRAFEAAARHESLTRAAEELFVTHGAISRQVQEIEAWAGMKLFERRGRRLVLTAPGRAYRHSLTAAFDAIAAASDRLRRATVARCMTVNALPTFTMRWLLPRLGRFQQEHPDVEVRLATSDRPLHQAEAPFDIAIRRGPLPWPGCRSAAFLQERELPVCSPSTLKRGAIAVPQDLARHVLLEAETRPESWRIWLTMAGVPDLAPAGRHVFDHFYLCLQAAADGLGVALGPLPLIRDELASGRLVAPLAGPEVPTRSYCWVMPPGRESDAAAEDFCAWLEREGAQDGGAG